MKSSPRAQNLAWPLPVFLLALAGLALPLLRPTTHASPETTESAKPFVVFGSVLGPTGRPMAGVEVTASCGNGTLFCTGRTLTDNTGAYRLGFGPGVLVGKSYAGEWGVGLQAATIFASKTGYACADLCRAGNLAMTDLTNVQPDMVRGFVGVVRPSQPYRLDFVMVPAARIEGELGGTEGRFPEELTLSLGGTVLPPSSSVLRSTRIKTNGVFAFLDVPVGSNWWFEADWRESGEWKSAKTKSFTCPVPKAYRAALVLKPGGKLELESLQARDR
ncbi:MAG TPA: carboxypeptidase-like regulatory domain-containing protein [Verrucomicrobiae bacterium]|nr:carboxypeptidase-like regulatory domain-containing protein [Verrucomicrobiae bacterium]